MEPVNTEDQLDHTPDSTPNIPRELFPRIVSDPAILHGKPIIQGTRLSVETVLERLATGYSIEDILGAYPFLSQEDIRAIFAFAAHQVGHELIMP